MQEGLYHIAEVTIRVFLQLNRTMYYNKISFYVDLKHIKNSRTF